MELTEIKKSPDPDQEMVDGRDGAESVENSLLSLSNNYNGEEAGNGDIKGNQRKSQKNCLCNKEGQLKKAFAAIALIVIIAVVIIISVTWCFANSDDEDEIYDQTMFKLQQKFNGSFQMPAYPFSNETQGPNDVQQKLTELYKSSPALSRFFSEAETFRLRSDSTVVHYKLTFVFPEEQQTELRNFTLSWEMVYNVFRQFLYDQDEDNSTMFIDPGSLEMHTMH
ncbi:TPA-induced transmembrane protein homolog [Anableps anableps]